MEVRVAHKYARISPTKVRGVVDLIRGANANEAFDVLRLTRKRASPMIAKLLRSAVATAAERFDIGEEELVVAKAWVDVGPVRKGWWARPRGMAGRLRYRTSHIHIVVAAAEKANAEGKAS